MSPTPPYFAPPSPVRRNLLLGAAAALAAPPLSHAQTPPSPAQAVVFDALGTLFDTSAIEAEAVLIWPVEGKRLTEFWRLKQLEYTWLSSSAQAYIPLSELSRQAFDFAAAACGVTARPEDFARLNARYGGLPSFPDVKRGLARLDRKLAILSASGPALLQALVKANGLETFNIALLSTDQVRAYKPDPRAYALAADQLGFKPDQILFVSSNGFDVWGAARFGFQTAWLRRPTSAPESGVYDQLRGHVEGLAPGPGHVISKVDDISALLKSG